MRNYAHDMHGALMYGYIRRLRTAVETACDEASGWARPYNPSNASARSRVALTLGELLLYARRLGLTEDEITKLLEREKATGEFGCQGNSRDRDIAADRWETDHKRENPAYGSDWIEYDAYVDGLSDREQLRRLLKDEARLRAQAQREAGIA